MPWGEKSIVQMDPRLSNDGPILWVRPGEQLVPTAELTKTPMKRQRLATFLTPASSFVCLHFFFGITFSLIICHHISAHRTRINELRNLQYLPRLSEARETMFEDRTKAHADHVGHGHERMTTAAVGKNHNFLCYYLTMEKMLLIIEMSSSSFRCVEGGTMRSKGRSKSHHERCGSLLCRRLSHIGREAAARFIRATDFAMCSMD